MIKNKKQIEDSKKAMEVIKDSLKDDSLDLHKKDLFLSTNAVGFGWDSLNALMNKISELDNNIFKLKVMLANIISGNGKALSVEAYNDKSVKVSCEQDDNQEDIYFFVPSNRVK